MPLFLCNGNSRNSDWLFVGLLLHVTISSVLLTRKKYQTYININIVFIMMKTTIKYYRLLLLLSCKCDDDVPCVYGINNMYKKYILIRVTQYIYVFAQGIHINILYDSIFPIMHN